MAIFQPLVLPSGVLMSDVPKDVDMVQATAEEGEFLLVS